MLMCLAHFVRMSDSEWERVLHNLGLSEQLPHYLLVEVSLLTLPTQGYLIGLVASSQCDELSLASPWLD